MAARLDDVSRAVLARLGLPQRRPAVAALKGWAQAEGGHFNNDARFNPWNTTLNLPGSGDTGTQGNISVYRNWRQGVKATAKTLSLPAYAGIRQALRSGSKMDVARAIDQSPWGTHGDLVYRTVAGARAGGSSRRAARLARGAGGGSVGGLAAIQSVGPAPADVGGGGNFAAVLGALGSSAPSGPPVSAPAAPSFAAGPNLPAGYAAPSGGVSAAPRASVDDLLASLRTVGDGLPAAPQQTTTLVPTGGGARRGGRPSTGGVRVGGAFKGAKAPADQLARIGLDRGLKVMSTKRDNTNPYSGSGSDHDHGNTDAYAYDLSNGSAPTPEMDETAFRVMRALGDRSYKRGQPIDTSRGVFTVKTKRGTVRVQVIYRGSGAAFGGNHLNHVHIGVKRVG